MKNLLIILLIAAFAGCKAERTMVTDTKRETLQWEVFRNVDTVIEGDTAMAVYRFVKPEGNTTEGNTTEGTQAVAIEKVSEKAGKYVRAPKVLVKDGQLLIFNVADPQVIPVEVKDTYTDFKETVTKTELVFENRLTTFQTVRVWAGNIVIIALAALVVVQILRVKKILKF